jgi:hypothetical protein
LAGNRERGHVRSVRRVRDSFLTLTDYALGLPEKAKKILKLLGAGSIARDVAEAVPCSKSTVNYWKNKFLNVGALRLVKTDVFKEYALTTYGSNVLTTGESGVGPEVCCLEDQAIKFEVIEWGNADRLDWKKLGRPRNWEKLGVKIGNVRVVRTSKSIIIHPGRLRGFDVDELLMLSGRIVERVRMVLENRFELVLSEFGSSLHQPVTRFYSEEAGELVKLGTTIVEDVGSIDKSPPERVPHEEYIGKDLAKARLLMPLKVTKLECRVEDIERKLIKLNDNVGDLVRLLKRALVPEESGELASQSLEHRKYIS